MFQSKNAHKILFSSYVMMWVVLIDISLLMFNGSSKKNLLTNFNRDSFLLKASSLEKGAFELPL